MSKFNSEFEEFHKIYSIKEEKYRNCFQIQNEITIKSNYQLPYTSLNVVLNFVKETKRLEKLICYIKDLDKDQINLEDLTDIIDDTSEETDAFIQ